jgi:TolA-binding protein
VSAAVPAAAAVPSVVVEDPHTLNEAKMREQLLKKQKELLELQQKKLELELLQTKARLEEQQKQLERQTGHLQADHVQVSGCCFDVCTNVTEPMFSLKMADYLVGYCTM